VSEKTMAQWQKSNEFLGGNGKWFARITFTDNFGKRKNIVKSVADKT
jgi:hypothetical protein